MLWQGAPVTLTNPAQARRLGIGMVFQHFSLFEALTARENIALGLDDSRDRVGLRARIIEMSARYGLPVDPDHVVHDLSVGERQRIEILRCLLQTPRLLILDEPTSVLTPGEASALFATLRRLAGEGCAILYISHKLEEVRALCDTATMLRGGRVVARCVPRDVTAHALAALMTGVEIRPPDRVARAMGPPRLVLDRLGAHAISLTVASGEILAIAGIAGNGQIALMQALSGETRAGRSDAILLDGREVGALGPDDRRQLGACFVPEERNGHAAAPEMSLAENAFLSAHARAGLARFGVIDRRATRGFAERVIAGFDVRTTGADATAQSLSGGNLQKFLVGREMALDPGVLVISQPTWGVDAAAAASIHAAIQALAAKGAAVLVISQDLDEIFALADRIAVIAGGRLSPPVPAAGTSRAAIGLLMGGAHA
jgi:simple sugar transport system ATP-binding protein